VLAGLDVGDLLGVGGSGSVWAAVGGGRAAAVKVAHGAGEVWQLRFAREADGLAALGPPHAPELLGSGVLADGRPWIAMERLGESVADELADLPGPPDPAWAGPLADAILAAVEDAHRRGLVHRDLKPENLFLRAGDAPSVAITDFGLAARDPTRGPGWARGTLGYMAPEVLAGADGDGRADVYALGVVLYELFTGRIPFAGDGPALEHAHLALRPPPPARFAPIARAVDELILTCLAKQPERRAADAAELRRRLRACAGEAGAIAAPAVDGAPAETPDELVALAWLDVNAGPAHLAAELARTPGLLARQHGRTCVAVFAPTRCERPAAAALAVAARLIAAWGGRASLHVDRVLLCSGDGRATVYGAPVDRPLWLPPGGWTGVVMTRDFVDALGDPAVIPADLPGFFAPAGALSAAPPPLVGRGALVDALAASARRSVDAARPGLVAVLGGPGSGKSRLLAEAEVLAGAAGAACVRVDIAERRAAEPLDGEALRERARRGPLAILVDDAHLADDAVLDALEYATLDGAGLPLWIVVAADGRALDQIRPRFGKRAERSERLELEPLLDPAMRELAASLLVPADYLPAAVLDRLAVLAGGNPGLLSELVRALKREGAVRPRPDRRSHEVAIEAIERVPATAAGRWEASRALDGLPAELAASARAAAALGPVFDEAELDWVEDALERDREGSFFDAHVALRALRSRDLVAPRGSGAWAFASPLVQDAIYQAMPPGERIQIHRHALGYWRGRAGGRALAALARHAGLAGAHAEARAAALALAASAAAAHRDLEADRWYSVALLHVEDQASRVRALVGRGRVRWRLDRAPEALADLAAARALATSVGDAAELAGILLDEAMVLDWAGDFEASAARVDEARPLVDGTGDAALAARLLVATGRTLWRQERVDEALDRLAEGAARAADPETRLIALLLSGCALSWTGRIDRAAEVFSEAENLAHGLDDRLHLCGVHVNRLFLWLAREDVERGADELRRAVQLARELGHPDLERAATHNLAELLHAEGRSAEALPLAIRAFELQQRFVARPGPENALLLSRIAWVLGDRESAARHLAWVEAHVLPADTPPTQRAFHRALQLAQRGGGADEWDSLVEDARGLLPVEYLEILYLRAATEVDAGAFDACSGTFAAARTYIERFPAWRAQFEGLVASTPAWGNMQHPIADPESNRSNSSPSPDGSKLA
jgi:eukaryotic-like serine/threonine-protein kinase